MPPFSSALPWTTPGAFARLEQRRRRQVRFDHPWHGLREHLAGRDAALPLIGYGSLMSRISAERTLTLAPGAGLRPVVALGAQRVFNYVMPDEAYQRAGGSEDPRARAALNVYPDPSGSHHMNGVLVDVIPDDLDALRQREAAYDLEPVYCVPWEDAATEPTLAYILCAPDRAWQGRRYTDDAVLPQPRYLELCEQAAREYGDDFHGMFLATTYMANRGTTLEAWLAGGASERRPSTP